MGPDDLLTAVAACRLVLLDTMVFSYHLSSHPRYSPLTRAVLESIESGKVGGVTTTLTLAELLTVPATAHDQEASRDYEIYLTAFPNLRLVPLDVPVAREVARVRAYTGMRTPDAIQVASARLAGADAIVTNDRRWLGRVTSPALILLDEYLT